MAILLACDCPVKAARLRHALEHNGFECPLDNVVGLDAVTHVIHKFDLILIVLPPNAEHGQEIVKHLRESSDADILAIGPCDPHLILGALRAGATDFLNESGDFQSELCAALGRLSAAHRSRAVLGQLITVVAASGGTGRTLLATNLAVLLAKTEGRCGLLDFDLGGADVATQLNLKPRHTVADLCRNIEKFDQKMFEQSLLEDENGLFVLAAPETWDVVPHVTAEGLEKIGRFGRMLFSSVVLDLNPCWQTEFAHILQQSTSILLLCRLNLSAIRNARRALQFFDGLGVDRANVQLVAARCGRAKEISSDQAEMILESEIQHFMPEDASAVNSCVNCGVPVVVESSTSSLAKAISGIAETVANPAASLHVSAEMRATGASSRPIVEKVRTFLGMSIRPSPQKVRASNLT